MATKTDLLAEILRELRRAQVEPWKAPPPGRVKVLSFPAALPLPDGMQLTATDELLRAVHDYARLYWENDPAIKPRIKIDEFVTLAKHSFGQVLSAIDLDEPDEQLGPDVKAAVDQSLHEQLQQHHRPIDLTVGCHLLDGDDAYPIRVGPVIFETRRQWQQRMVAEDKLSSVTARRIAARWRGRPLGKRKPSHDSQREKAILDAIDGCPTICTVETDGLSTKYIHEKGLLAARLAMTAVSMLWIHPSKGLEWMNLLYDRRLPLRNTVMFGKAGVVGSNSGRSQMPFGRWTDTEFLAELRRFQWLFDQIGEVLFSYVQPVRESSRPNIKNALFLSLWWFHEACREPSDQIATTKFAASMDALTNGGKANGIVKYLGVRAGYAPEGKLMVDGRTTKETIKRIYDAGRSRLIHGSSEDFAHDWSELRQAAEAVGRRCLVLACEWMEQNPSCDDIKAMSGA